MKPYSTNGKFGPITVLDINGCRRLYIKNQQQGASALTPSSKVVSKELEEGPGPVGDSAYFNGLVLAGMNNPDDSILVIGLGSGGGIVSLLYNCPNIDVTVLEIDPAMIDIATKYFPLLNYYIDQGRLNIINIDAKTYLSSNEEEWALSFADAYIGTNETVQDYLPALIAKSETIYLNVIDRLNGPIITNISKLMKSLDKPISYMAMCHDANNGQINFNIPSNWILTNDEVDLDKTPRNCNWLYKDLSGQSVTDAKVNFRSMLDNVVVIGETVSDGQHSKDS